MTQTVQIPLAGDLYEHTSSDVNYQRQINFVSFLSGMGGRGNQTHDKSPVYSILPSPGYLEILDLYGKEVRAVMKFDTKLYAVVDDKVYKWTLNSTSLATTSLLLGTIGTSSGQISWDANRSSQEIMFVTGISANNREGWLIDTATDTLAEITDDNFNGGITVRQLDGYFIVNTPNSDQLQATAINDGSDIDPLDFSSAVVAPDKTVAVERDKGDLWIFGENSIEVWYNPGSGSGFPFERRSAAFIDNGCASAFSIQRINNTLIWLNDLGEVVQGSGYNVKVISNDSITKQIQSFKGISNSLSYQYLDRGHIFYAITFPTQKKTFVYDLSTNLWHEQASWTTKSDFTRARPNCSVRYDHLNIVGDFESGKIYVMGSDYLDENGSAIHRIKTLPYQHSEQKQISVSSLELHLGVGDAPITGEYSDPYIKLRYSSDGGHTWSHELIEEIGRTGEYSQRVIFPRLGTAREWLFEISYSESANISLVDAWVSFNIGR